MAEDGLICSTDWGYLYLIIRMPAVLMHLVVSDLTGEVNAWGLIFCVFLDTDNSQTPPVVVLFRVLFIWSTNNKIVRDVVGRRRCISIES